MYYDKTGKEISIDVWGMLSADSKYIIEKQSAYKCYTVVTGWIGIDKYEIFETLISCNHDSFLDGKSFRSKDLSLCLAIHDEYVNMIELYVDSCDECDEKSEENILEENILEEIITDLQTVIAQFNSMEKCVENLCEAQDKNNESIKVHLKNQDANNFAYTKHVGDLAIAQTELEKELKTLKFQNRNLHVFMSGIDTRLIVLESNRNTDFVRDTYANKPFSL